MPERILRVFPTKKKLIETKRQPREGVNSVANNNAQFKI